MSEENKVKFEIPYHGTMDLSEIPLPETAAAIKFYTDLSVSHFFEGENEMAAYYIIVVERFTAHLKEQIIVSAI